MPVGFERLIRGVLKYEKTLKSTLVKQFKEIRDNPQPKAVMFTCMDSRLLPTRFTQAQVGDMFIVRNAGNTIPPASTFGHYNANRFDSEVSITTEPAALELACARTPYLQIGSGPRGGIQHVVVLGHSDCKAMNTLYGLAKNPDTFEPSSSIDCWLRRHAYVSYRKLEKRLENGPNVPLKFAEQAPEHVQISAYIDKPDKLVDTDKLSQIHCLQQIEHIATHLSMQKLLAKHKVHVHAMWFDIFTGHVWYFSRPHNEFIVIDENSVDGIIAEALEM